MQAAAPPVLSGLSETLLRRPPSLGELIVRLGYAEDYAWFAELVRRLFPDEADAALAAPDVGARVEGFARLFQERHFPLYAPYLEFFTDEDEDPALHLAAAGHPLPTGGHRLRRPPRDVGRLPGVPLAPNRSSGCRTKGRSKPYI